MLENIYIYYIHIYTYASSPLQILFWMLFPDQDYELAGSLSLSLCFSRCERACVGLALLY